MVVAASLAHRVFRGQPPAGNRFAGIENLDGQTRDCFDKLLCQAGDAAHMLQEVEGRPFHAKDGRLRSMHVAKHVAGLDAPAVFKNRFETQLPVNHSGDERDRQAIRQRHPSFGPRMPLCPK